MTYFIKFFLALFWLCQPQLYASEVLFEGKDILVEGNFFHSKNLWICFNELKVTTHSSLQENSETHFILDNYRWGQPFLNNRQMDSINIVNIANHWYQTPEMTDVIEKINQRIQRHPYENIITYGISQGAYGAILFSEKVKATRVLAFSPQVHFKDLERAEHRIKWKKLLKLEPIFLNPVAYNTCDFYIIYAFSNVVDRATVEDKEGLPSIITEPTKLHLYPLNTDNHYLPQTLSRNILKNIVEKVDDGDTEKLEDILFPYLVNKGA